MEEQIWSQSNYQEKLIAVSNQLNYYLIIEYVLMISGLTLAISSVDFPIATRRLFVDHDNVWACSTCSQISSVGGELGVSINT
jgi:hypothetical protein